MIGSKNNKVISLRWRKIQRKYKNIFEFSSRLTALFRGNKGNVDEDTKNTNSKNIYRKSAIK